MEKYPFSRPFVAGDRLTTEAALFLNGLVDAMASSSGTTGGTGSAGSGNQYVEITIGGTTYKVLHDGAV